MDKNNYKKLETKLDNIEKLFLGQKNVLTLNEFCKYAGISQSYAYKLTSQNKINYSKPNGKMIFFKLVDIEKWLLRNPVKTSEQLENEAINYVTTNQNKN